MPVFHHRLEAYAPLHPIPNRTNPMKTPQSICTLAALTVALFLPAPAVHATIVSADSTDTLVETRWVQADSSNVLIDGFTDGYEVAQGFSPTSDTSSPDTRMVAYTAVEIRFGAGVGKTYRIESSVDLQTWPPVETGIPGTGTEVTRFYTTQIIPKRYFRAVRE